MTVTRSKLDARINGNQYRLDTAHTLITISMAWQGTAPRRSSSALKTHPVRFSALSMHYLRTKGKYHAGCQFLQVPSSREPSLFSPPSLLQIFAGIG
eukprot:1139402-Pelagomonas_calceolata.AAC.4